MRDNRHGVDWNWDTFSGKVSHHGVLSHQPTRPAEAPTTIPARAPPPREVIIPMVTLPAAFVKNGWSTTAFGGCAALRRREGSRLHDSWRPARGDSGDSEMRVVMSSGRVLFVEVTDDQLVPTAKSWVKADHLELWRVSDASSGRGSDCFQPDPNAKALQWGIGSTARCTRPTVRRPPTRRSV